MKAHGGSFVYHDGIIFDIHSLVAAVQRGDDVNIWLEGYEEPFVAVDCHLDDVWDHLCDMVAP